MKKERRRGGVKRENQGRIKDKEDGRIEGLNEKCEDA